MKPDEDVTQYRLEGYASHFISIGNGKGIVTYYKRNMFRHNHDYQTEKMQITKFSTKEIDVINIYRSQNGHSVELLTQISNMLSDSKTTIITGDYNICYVVNGNNRMSKGLINQGFQQLVKEAAHIRGGHINHAYFRDTLTRSFEAPIVECYSPYYSDHDAICYNTEDNKEETIKTIETEEDMN